MKNNITFRTQLLGGVYEFCHTSKLMLINNHMHLVELIVLLARYKEEGVILCPKVYMTNRMNTLISMLPDSEYVKIGTETYDSSGIKQALKKCAPLASGGWFIYIQDNNNHIEYGIFKGSGNPISVLVDDVLMTAVDDIIIVKAFQIADDCVEVRANNGNYHYVFLNHRKEDSPPPLEHFDDLISSIVKNVAAEDREPTIAFLNRILSEALRQSHGCIIAVTDKKTAPKFLSNDGVILESAIDFPNLVSALKKKTISASLMDSKGSLLQGMLNSDGIVIFDDRGRLLGYNCFVKVTQAANVIGGARKRAFATLVNKLGNGLQAVFMQSQDGWSEFRRNENV